MSSTWGNRPFVAARSFPFFPLDEEVLDCCRFMVNKFKVGGRDYRLIQCAIVKLSYDC